MSYSDFTIDGLKEKFNLNFVEDQSLLIDIPDYEVPQELQRLLEKFIPLALAIDTEKARSEFIIAPLLAELKLSLKSDISLFSGIEFNVDKTTGLTGRCDYIISKSKEQYSLSAPVLVMVEAKNDNIKSGIPQCGAEMVAAQRFNQDKRNEIDTIFGCVSTGTNWKFLKLAQRDFYIDTIEYYIQSPEKIMGILARIAIDLT
ncbi:MAG: hypothetical protein F6K19_32055 [Cyanothece sp. SIO1E1]|nr:hypothetical protein [Cyanothece sp. SIO1E1]